MASTINVRQPSRIQQVCVKVIKSGILIIILGIVTNCTDLRSNFQENEGAHLAQNPVFNETTRSYTGIDHRDRGLSSNDNSDGGLSSTDGPDNGVNGDSDEPFVVVEMTVARAPFQFCEDGGFQVLKRDGTYTKCRPCLAEGSRPLNGGEVSVCEVQRCDQENQYIFLGDDVTRPSRSCERCDVMSGDNSRCLVVVAPPANDLRREMAGSGRLGAVCENNPAACSSSSRNDEADDRGGGSNRGGGSGGGSAPAGGGGDPLMIDSQGVEYASEQALKESEASYFSSGDLSLTNPNPIAGVDHEDIAERANFEGFNLLGQQTVTVLDSSDFLHINEAGKNFKFQKMSWTRSGQSRYQFLALPDANGHVLGIDQLFGDNTYGPWDHQPFADDGFYALMKYDMGDTSYRRPLGPDGVIDKTDAVFSKLRLWHDKNGDGNVDNPAEIREELSPLSSFGITFISLNPNEKFYETDKYGNDIAYKAIVGFESEDGKPKLGTAFDMWFQYDPREILEADGGTLVAN